MRRRRNPPQATKFNPGGPVGRDPAWVPDMSVLWTPAPPRRAVIEVEWLSHDDDAKAATAAEAACDSLMERLVDEGVTDPAVSLSLPERMRRG